MAKLMTEKVTEVHHWNDTLFSFKTTRDMGFRFKSGHFTMIGLEAEGRPLLRAYSIVSANYEEELEFFSIKVPDGPLTSKLQNIQIGDEVFVNNKPTGTLTLDNLLPGRNLYLFSTGTGLAPFISIIKDPEVYHNKKVIIAGGGDSALDWTIFLENIAASVTLIHRRNEFRGALDSVEKVQQLKNKGRIQLLTPAEVIALEGDDFLDSVIVNHLGDSKAIECDSFIPLFGLTPKLGPIANWGLEIKKNAILVDNSLDYQTNIPGIYAIGDVNTYPGKLKLILCGYHEATLMVQSAFAKIHPEKKNVLKYTTVNGVNGF